MTPPTSHDGGEGATERPWRLHDMEQSTIVGQDHLAIADCNAISRGASECRENTDLILLAVNSFDALKAENERMRGALEEIAAVDCPGEMVDGILSGDCGVSSIAKAALSDKKGGV